MLLPEHHYDAEPAAAMNASSPGALTACCGLVQTGLGAYVIGDVPLHHVPIQMGRNVYSTMCPCKYLDSNDKFTVISLHPNISSITDIKMLELHSCFLFHMGVKFGLSQ